MKVHEHQAKELLRAYNVAVPAGKAAYTVDEAVRVAQELGGNVWVVKAQIHAGGRGKGGGVKVVHSIEEVRETATRMLGMTLVTAQTGPAGRAVRRLLVEQGVAIARELYVGMTLDRVASRLVAMASTEGGVEIERVAAETPEKILKQEIDRSAGLLPFQARALAVGLGLTGTAFKSAVTFLQGLYRAYQALDCSLAEINPLVVTTDGAVLALDAKMTFDDNALDRHPELKSLRDEHEEDPLEVAAANANLNYVKLDGNVGCMVNGAGLAMATMDIIKLAGGEPANFLDVGGGASVETVSAGFNIILGDPHVKAILINIFGGIVRCDRVATGVVEAARRSKVSVPVVIRLAGTNAERARDILRESGLNFLVASSLEEAADKVTGAIRA